METATLTWGLLAAALAIAVAAGLWWRGQQRRRAEVARQAAAAAEAAQQAQRTLQTQKAAQQAAEKAAELKAQQEAQQAAQYAAQQAAQAAAAARAAERQRAEQTIRAQAEREAQQHARAEAERAAAAEAARRAERDAQAAAEARARQEAAAANHPTPVPTPVPAPSPRRPADTLVMVADDSKVVRVKTSRLLAQHGYRVVLAEDGAQAAQLIEAEVPAVLVTDVEMPGLDGFELTRHVRAHPRAGRIPIIMITSADDRLKAAAAEAGVTLVLGKPYPEDELIACIERSQATATA